LAIALIVLGPERFPQMLRTTGKLLRELRLASNTVLREISDALEDEPNRTTVMRPINPSSGATTEPHAAISNPPPPKPAAHPSKEG